MRLSAGKWAELVEAWESSGQPARVFADERGVAEASLRWWKSELARRARSEPARRSPGPRPRVAQAIAMARVVREGEVRSADASETVVVVIGQARVVVQRDFDPALLRAVVHALGGAT